MPNPRTPSKPLLVPPPHTTKAAHTPTRSRRVTPDARSPTRSSRVTSDTRSPARSSSRSSTPSRKVSGGDKEELSKPRWSGYIKGPNTTRQAMSQTRIPRLPNRGKENTVPGARIAKPVSRPKIPVEIGNVSPPGVLTSSSKVDGLQSSKSPNVISSKTVPHLHNKLLAKIKQNKRKSGARRIVNQAPCKAPAPVVDTNRVKDIETSDRESPVSAQELDTYLASMFYMVDTYRTGLVSARSLLEYLANLTDLPKLDKWKLEELSRMLDPNTDKRYVDMERGSEGGNEECSEDSINMEELNRTVKGAFVPPSISEQTATDGIVEEPIISETHERNEELDCDPSDQSVCKV